MVVSSFVIIVVSKHVVGDPDQHQATTARPATEPRPRHTMDFLFAWYTYLCTRNERRANIVLIIVHRYGCRVA